MIDLYSGELRDLLPPYFKYQPDITAYSAALKAGIGYAQEWARRTILLADIDELPEYLLDYMAIELDAKYYDSAEDVAIKRQYIKNALYWKMKAGTIEAVEELIRTTFGEATISIWKEFGGEPGTFRVETDAKVTKEIYEKFTQLIESIKTESAHMEGLAIRRDLQTGLSVGIAAALDQEEHLTNDINVDNPDQAYIYAANAAIYDFAEGIETLILTTAGQTESQIALYAGLATASDAEQALLMGGN